jgi:hypothetical protein
MPQLCYSFSDREVSTMMLEGFVNGQWSMVDVNDVNDDKRYSTVHIHGHGHDIETNCEN